MYRRRLRPRYTDDQLKRVYQQPHDSNKWEDHKIRVRNTIALGMGATMPKMGIIADLSCGNGLIAKELAVHFNAGYLLGDFAKGAGHHYTGPIEQTIDQMGLNVDLFICSETIEHLDDPEQVLRKIRTRSAQLLLSTPIAEKDDSNPEHYWGWDQEAVYKMLVETGWHPLMRSDLLFTHPAFIYNYQIWLCK